MTGKSDYDCTGEFIEGTQWTCRYQRNNKRSGLKNLRCFPFCSEDHKLRGFCGRSTKVKVEGIKNLSRVMFYGEFVKSAPDDAQRFKTGACISRADCVERERTKELMFNPWFKGDLESQVGGDVIVEFNKKRKGWHYGWVANKHTCDSEHVFRVYVLEEVSSGNNLFKIIYTFDSPSFTIFCRRRQREFVPNLPPQIRAQLEQAKQVKLLSLSEEKLSAAKTLASIVSLDRKRKASLLESGSKLEHNQEVKPSMAADSQDEFQKRRKSQKNAEKMIGRVIQALLEIDFRFDNMEDGLVACCSDCDLSKPVMVDETKDYTTDSKASAKLGSHYFCQVCNKLLPQPELDGRIKLKAEEDQDFRLDEFLEIFLPEMASDDFDLLRDSPIDTNDPLSPDWSHHSFNEQLDLFSSNFNLDFDSSLRSATETSLNRDQVLEDLGRFLIDENCLTKAIERLLRSSGTQNKSFKERKSLVFGIFAEQIQIFLNRFGIGLEQFDKMLKQPSTRPGVQKIRKSESSEASSNIASKIELEFEQPMYFPKPCSLSLDEKLSRLKIIQQCVTGDWVHDNRISTIHELIRQELGIPWLVRKMMAKMEKFYSVWFTNVDKESIANGSVQMSVGCKGKLLSSGQQIYTFDAQEHSHNLEWPLPVQNPEQKIQTVPRSKAYIDFEDYKLVMFHHYGLTHRTVRRLGLIRDESANNRFLTELAYEVREDINSPWVTKFYYKKFPVLQTAYEQLG